MNSKYILKTLKTILKSKKLTYKILAEKIGISEAGIKKMFVSGDLTLSRLILICDLLHISLSDLIQASQNRTITQLKFNQQQINYFSKYPHYFSFFLKLCAEDGDTKDIVEKYQLTEKSTWKYLKKLDELKLIQLLPDNKVQFYHTLPLTINPEGEFFKNLIGKYANTFIQNIQNNKEERNKLNMTQFRLSIENSNRFRNDLLKLQNSYQRQSEVDKVILKSNELNDFSLLIAYGEISFIPEVINI